MAIQYPTVEPRSLQRTVVQIIDEFESVNGRIVAVEEAVAALQLAATDGFELTKEAVDALGVNAAFLSGLRSTDFARASHTHAASEITGLDAAVQDFINLSNIDADTLGGIASNGYARFNHVHSPYQISGLDPYIRALIDGYVTAGFVDDLVDEYVDCGDSVGPDPDYGFVVDGGTSASTYDPLAPQYGIGDAAGVG